MVAEAQRREFETRLGNALEMAANEWEVLSVAGRAVTSLVGDDRVEILLADNSNAHLERALVSGADPDGPGAARCSSPSQCVAARRGQTQVFNDSEALDACPHLQGRELRPLRRRLRAGVDHGPHHRRRALGRRGRRAARARSVIDQLEVLANQSGARIGMIRVVSESQLQATTDHLTGLLNRRAFEAKVRDLHRRRHALQPGDGRPRPLQGPQRHPRPRRRRPGPAGLRVGAAARCCAPATWPAATAARSSCWPCRTATATAALRVCERLREALALAGLDGTVPVFTCSFGVAPPRIGAIAAGHGVGGRRRPLRGQGRRAATGR